MRRLISSAGRAAISQAERLRYSVAVAAAVVWYACRPSTWTRTVRRALAEQIMFAGVGAIPFTVAVAFLTGLMIVVQAQLWLGRVGQSRLLAPLLVAVIVREVGPVLATLIVIGRSSGGTAVGLAHMKVTREVHALDALGLDPFIYLVLPRAVGTCLSAFCLGILLIVVALLGGYTCAAAMGQRVGGLPQFVAGLARAVDLQDVANVFLKTLIPGLMAGVLCCIEGLAVSSALEVPSAGTRGVQRSVAVLFVIASGLSVMTYVR